MRFRPPCAVVRTTVLALLVAGLAAGPAFAQAVWEGRVQAPDPWARQYFGSDVGVSGDTMVVGAPGTAGGAPLREGVGAVHVYVRDAASAAWELHSSLLGSDDAGVAPHFGQSVAVDGDTLVVGAPWADGHFPDTGAAYVYERDASGAWQHRATVRPSTSHADEMFFGQRVAISGSTIVVAAPVADDETGTSPTGAVYVYVRDAVSGVWGLEQVLRHANQSTFIYFGGDVAIDGDMLVVGAPWENSGATGVEGDESDTSAPSSGAAYVYVRAGGSWTRQAYLKASNTGSSDFFGQRVDASGNRAIVGAPLEDNDDANNDNAGAAYVFVRDTATGTWAQEAFLKPAGSQVENNFGIAVAIAGHRAAVGADIVTRATTAGVLALFSREASGAWVEREQLSGFGFVAAFSGQTLVVGSPAEIIDTMSNAGAAYVLTTPDTTPPIVAAPSDLLGVEATGEVTDVVLGTATVTDDSGEELVASADPAGPFPLGTFTVTWTATDSAGNAGTDTQIVQIVDTTAPVVTAPADIVAAAGDAVVLGEPTVAEAVGLASITNDWQGGDFPVGTTTVTWTAIDTEGNSGSDTQLVTIIQAVEPLDLDINAFRATGRVRAGSSQAVTFTFKVKNQTGNGTDSGSATLVGTMDNGTEVYRATLAVIGDPPGGGATSWEFPQYVTNPSSPLGVVTWVVTVGDADADVDTSTATTRVVR